MNDVYHRPVNKSYKLSEQGEALALDLFRQGVPYELIAEAVNRTPLQTKRIIERLLDSWEIKYPGLAGLSFRLAMTLIHAGIFTREDATQMLRTGTACYYEGITPRTLPTLCAWCGIKLIEQHYSGRYWVEGQIDLRDLQLELEKKIRVAKENITVWKKALRDAESWEPSNRLPGRYPSLGSRFDGLDEPEL